MVCEIILLSSMLGFCKFCRLYCFFINIINIIIINNEAVLRQKKSPHTGQELKGNT